MPTAGDVVLIEFPGAVVAKRRPAVVLSTALYHGARPDVIVGVITGQVAKATAPTDHVLADWAAAGLKLPSAFRCYLATLPQSGVITRFGRLSPADWQAVQQRVRLSIAT